MINVSISLPDDVESALDARVRDGGFSDLAAYLRALIQDDISAEKDWGGDDDWVMTPELAAALEHGERSGISERSIDEIFAEARSRYAADSK